MMKLTLLAIASAMSLPVFASLGDTNVPHLPRFNEAYRIATHNSYWVGRSKVWDPFASGVQEQLLDQLLFDRVRTLEIDIHKSRSRAGDWRVYHTDIQSNVFCTPLSECLKQLQQFQYALPNHEPVTVVLELKEILESNFDSTHTPADLDRLIESMLGPYLYRPRDLLARCQPGLTMRQCVAQAGWPTVAELRGKFMFAMLGNWRWCTIGHGASGWATYATWQGPGESATDVPASHRSGFPMESNFGNWDKDDCGNEGIPEPEQTNAKQASVFLQVESFDPAQNKENVADFLAGHGIVRVDGTQSLDQQALSESLGIQQFQGDYPWFQTHTPEWTRIFHPFHPELFAEPVLVEPGDRLAMLASTDGAPLSFSTVKRVAPLMDWQTLPSSTRPSTDPIHYPNPHHASGKGCLRAESADGSQSASLCRQVVAQQGTAVTAEIRRHGLVLWRKTFYGGLNFSNGVGSLLRLVSFADGSGGSCVSLFTASEMADAATPRWTALKTHCFDAELSRQGLAASQGDVLFARTHLNGAAIRALDLAAPTTGYQLEDFTAQP